MRLAARTDGEQIPLRVREVSHFLADVFILTDKHPSDDSAR